MDVNLFTWLNGLGAKSHLFYLVTWLITDHDVVFFTILFGLCLLLHRRHFGKMWSHILLSLAAGAVALVLSAVLGELMYRPRPFDVLPIEKAQLLLPQNSDSSLLSELTAVAVAFAMGMWGAPGRLTPWVFTTLAVYIGISQIAIGFHWPSDVLASAMSAGGSTYLVYRWDRSRFGLPSVVRRCRDFVQQVKGYRP